jgi:uncharacterized RDD family membrane protein YckC
MKAMEDATNAHLTTTVPTGSSAGTCPSCGRHWGDGVACQFCDQISGMPEGVKLASVGIRFGGYLLEAVLFIVTLVIGWIVWSLIVWGRGQTPAKQLLGMYCVKLARGERATWGAMLVREFVGKGLIMGALGLVTFGIAPLILNFRLIWNKNRQELWDSVAGTVVARG